MFSEETPTLICLVSTSLHVCRRRSEYLFYLSPMLSIEWCHCDDLELEWLLSRVSRSQYFSTANISKKVQLETKLLQDA